MQIVVRIYTDIDIGDVDVDTVTEAEMVEMAADRLKADGDGANWQGAIFANETELAARLMELAGETEEESSDA